MRGDVLHALAIDEDLPTVVERAKIFRTGSHPGNAFALFMRSTCRRVVRRSCDERRAARTQAIMGERMLVLRPRSAFKTLRHWQ
jgi:hypothetical protein